MNKLFKSIISIIGLSMAFAGCVGDFDDMNTDPNNPTPGSVDPKFQLIFIQGRGIPYANQWQQIDQLMISTFCEYSANDGLSASDYNIDARYVDNIWELTYTVLTNANSLIRANESNPVHNNVVQMTRIWKAYAMLRLTNCMGDVPYSEAANDIDMGDKVEVDFTTGVITNHTKNKTYQAEPFPEFMQEMFKVGGLVEQTKVKLGLK